MLLAFINRCVRAPLAYLADLRAISMRDYLLLGTNFSPSYPIMIFTALGFTLMYCAILIYFVFTSAYTSACYAGVHGAAYLIAILYPIESLLCFVCLTGSVALSKSNCWKVILITLFGPVLCGFGFGEVGIIQLCLLSGDHHDFPLPFILSQPGFVDTIVYLYLSFLALYFILIPSIGYLYRRQNEDSEAAKNTKPEEKPAEVEGENKEEKKGVSCCSRFVCVVYYICNIFFVFAAIGIILMKIAGPILYTYIWIKIGVNIGDFTQPMEQLMFASLILAYFAPLASMFITLAIQRLVKLGSGKKDGQGKAQEGREQETSIRSTWQPNAELSESPTSNKDSQKRISVSSKNSEKPSIPEKRQVDSSIEGQQQIPSEQPSEKRAPLL